MPAAPQDPDFEQRVRTSFERQGFMRTLGAELVSVAEGACEIRCPIRDEIGQQHGYAHAGAVTALADSAAGYAAYSLMPADSSVLTVEFKLNLVAPARGELLVARASVVKAGRTLTVCEASVDAVEAGEPTRCAVALLTLIALAGSPDQGRS